MTTQSNDGRRTEGGIEWRGKTCAEPEHRHSRCVFRVRVFNGIDPSSGRRRFLYETGRGNARDADRAVRELLNKRDGGLDVQPRKVGTTDWIGTFIDDRVADGALSPRVESNYRGMLKHHLTPHLGHIRLQDLRADHVLALKAAIVEAGLAPATVKKVLGLVRQALGGAVVGGLITRNPADAVPSPSLVRDSVERRSLTEAEVRAVLQAAEGTPYATLIRFALATGLRQSEMLGLRWADVDLDGSTLEVRQTVTYLKGKGFVYQSPKTRNSRRTVELSAAIVALLKMHKKAQDVERERLGEVWHDLDLVFPGPDGRPQWQKHILRGFRRVLDAARLPDGSKLSQPERVNWHTLRHSAASLWIKAGVDVFVVSRRLGHSSPAFTMTVYAHLLPGQQHDAAVALDHLVGMPGTAKAAR